MLYQTQGRKQQGPQHPELTLSSRIPRIESNLQLGTEPYPHQPIGT
jgi:hypothetical protein